MKVAHTKILKLQILDIYPVSQRENVASFRMDSKSLKT
uniref:Uncharacterized protein n=1 Tax=Rhizophora mucronata TaxID=61149 RepID=A0A2P2IKR4_RHIMU